MFRPVFALGLTLTGACVLQPEDPTAETAQDIHGDNDALASQWQRDRAADLGGCTATRISDRYAITALHCGVMPGNTLTFYGTGGEANPALTAKVEQVFMRPGATTAECQVFSTCADDEGHFADIAVLRLSNTVTSTTDSLLAGAPATLAWTFPGDGASGTKVGAGDHDGVANPGGTLRQIPDTIDGSDTDSMFYTDDDLVDDGDSGGPFYVGTRVVGTLWGRGQVGLDHYARHTSVPRHLDWILASMAYQWPGQPPQQDMAINGSPIESFTGTERECQYACEKTASCEAYNYSGSSCGLYTAITGTHVQSGWRGAIRHGASTGKSNEAVGYVRSDGWNSVVHKAADGNIHEFFRNADQWFTGTIFPMSTQPIAAISKLTAYRRSDGINAIVYRSNMGRIIEVALDPNEGWKTADLTNWGGPAPAGDPVAYVRADGVSAVVYRSANNHINELRLGTKKWIATDLTAVSNSTSLPAASDPVPFARADGVSSVVYRSGGATIELFKRQNQQWSAGVPSSLVTNGTAPAATGRPYGYTRRNGMAAIVYRSTANRAIELRLEGTGWKFEDITSTGQPVGGNPVGYVRNDAADSVVYRSASNQLTELTRSPLQAFNRSALHGIFPLNTDPSVFVRNDAASTVVYGLASNRVGALSLEPPAGFSSMDLSIVTGEVP